MRLSRVFALATGIWLLSSAALSSGLQAPELPVLKQARDAAEYPVLRQIQDLTLDLQLLEISIKNRRDPRLEARVAATLQAINDAGTRLAARFKELREDQLERIHALLSLGFRFGPILGVSPSEWEDLAASLAEGQLEAGALSVQGRAGMLDVMTIAPLTMGRERVWQVQLPLEGRNSFWTRVRRAQAFHGAGPSRALRQKALEARLSAINTGFEVAETAAKSFFLESYSRLFDAFEAQRYALLQRVTAARKLLQQLGSGNTAMGAPEEIALLYNQLLENLFSYGIDLSLTGLRRDLELKGFLFAQTPEEARRLYEKLKFTAPPASYNSPSS